mmetsp:Transcript_1814/g.6437  ORF Transcript_1814/g.6437 Transcript_1814/m.6437 type:complete len:152 (+) Transcript_1814:90-545(+)
MNNSTKRLQKELMKLTKEPPIPNCKITAKDTDITEWTVKIPGPASTPFDKGTFTFRFKFPKEYPFHSPEITCLHKVYHCNFDKEGKLCLDIVRKENWSPMIGVKEVVVAIQQLLREPNVGHPLDEDIAAQMEKDPKKYEASAKKYTKQYAK